MSYYQYKEEITQLVNGKSIEVLDAFANDIIKRIIGHVKTTSPDDLFESEKALITEIFNLIETNNIDFDKIGIMLDELTKISQEDEDHAIKMEVVFIEFLSALDNWRLFRKTKDKNAVVGVSENLMNILDHYYTDDADLIAWLAVPEIGNEFALQAKFLQ